MCILLEKVERIFIGMERKGTRGGMAFIVTTLKGYRMMRVSIIESNIRIIIDKVESKKMWIVCVEVLSPIDEFYSLCIIFFGGEVCVMILF